MEKFDIDPSIIVVNSEGLFINIHNEQVPISCVNADDNGI